MNEEVDRYSVLLEAIEAERAHEELFFNQINASKKIQDKVSAGLVWYPVAIVKSNFTLGTYFELEIERVHKTETGHKFKVGAAVLLFNNQEEKLQYKAVISYIRKDKMRILLHADKMPDHHVLSKGSTGVELVYDERPYRVMREALQNIMQTKNIAHRLLREAIRSGNLPQLQDLETIDSFGNWSESLNTSQIEAVKTAAKAPLISIIHGPPGTGKTTTVVALVSYLLANEKRILVCAPSNNAADLLAERISQKGVNVIRIGNISRIDDEIIHLTIEEKVLSHPEWSHIKKVKNQSQEKFRKADQFKRHFGHEERTERRELRKEGKDLMKWANELEDRLIQEIVGGASVIVSTLIGVSHKILKDNCFKTLIIDEASQALEPECWNAILKAERVILAGDHKQLPPTVKSIQAKNLGFESTLLDRMTDIIPYTSMLNMQYRMHNDILQFSNHKFYNNRLLSAASVESHKLRNDTKPLVFIDTAGCSFEEQKSEENMSLSNPGEYLIIREHLLLCFENVSGASIGIISPYADQVKYIKQQISEDEDIRMLDIDVNTVDGFQGREKELIYVSLVRSNTMSEIGFLKDERRLNVAMTRAKKKLVIVGDSATLGNHPLFTALLEHVEKNGYYDSAWNYMSY